MTLNDRLTLALLGGSVLLAAVDKHVAGSCFGNIHWSATTAASGQSVLAGVLAGFVFAGIVAVVSRGREAAPALKLLFCAFFGLAVAAYLLADQAADTYCLRASAEETLAGGILGTFSVIMIVSLSWLVVAYGLQGLGVLRFLRRLIYVASFFVALLLSTSSFTYLDESLPNSPSGRLGAGIYLAAVLLYVTSLPVLSAVRSLWSRLTGRAAADRCRSGDADARRVNVCAWVTLVYLAIAAIGDAVVVSMTDSAWNQPPMPVVQLIAWSSLVLPLIVLVFAMRALAPEGSDRKREQEPNSVPGQPALVLADNATARRFERRLDNISSLTLLGIAIYGLGSFGRWWLNRRLPGRR
jgi:hypothetical protein